jgi:hypothetical protein
MKKSNTFYELNLNISFFEKMGYEVKGRLPPRDLDSVSLAPDPATL